MAMVVSSIVKWLLYVGGEEGLGGGFRRHSVITGRSGVTSGGSGGITVGPRPLNSTWRHGPFLGHSDMQHGILKR